MKMFNQSIVTLLLIPAAFGLTLQPAYAQQHVKLNEYQQKWGFSPLVVTKGGTILWVGGHTTTTDENSKDISYDFKAQVRQIFKNIDADLRRAGGSLKNVVSITVYVNDPRNNEIEAGVIKEVFGDGPYPGSSLLTISNFARPGIVVEVQAVAVVGSEVNGTLDK